MNFGKQMIRHCKHVCQDIRQIVKLHIQAIFAFDGFECLLVAVTHEVKIEICLRGEVDLQGFQNYGMSLHGRSLAHSC